MTPRHPELHPGCPQWQPRGTRRLPPWADRGVPGIPRGRTRGEPYRTATPPYAGCPMVATARVPADGTRSNSGRQLAMSATTGNAKGSKWSARVTPNRPWQSPVSSDSSRFKLYDASGPSSPPPWSGRAVNGREFTHPSRNRGVTSAPCRCQPSDAAASRGYPGTTVGRQGGSRKWRNWAEKGISRDDTARRQTASCQ